MRMHILYPRGRGQPQNADVTTYEKLDIKAKNTNYLPVSVVLARIQSKNNTRIKYHLNPIHKLRSTMII